ncbi:MmyB family transcriptional regulator [Streptomyces violascens]|uniref:MmyB family transcriptional regulator n=1 Tax=Streptomyces violascens TaxID=67381 RepID=UPI00368D3B13
MAEESVAKDSVTKVVAAHAPVVGRPFALVHERPGQQAAAGECAADSTTTARTGAPEARQLPDDPELRAYVDDYFAMTDALPFPSVVLDPGWGVAHANPAYDALFGGIGPHPTAMPGHNFLRFVLFHPDAAVVLAEHETAWCLPMLAQFAEAYADDESAPGLRDIRQEIADDPIMDAAFRLGLPHWVRAVGDAAVHHDGAVRHVRHPDPERGRTSCRLVSESPRTLREFGFRRLTLVLRETEPAVTRRGRAHLSVVPAR